jgi:stage V sporulation protein AE
MEYVKAFLVGGAICAIVQILLDNTKLLPGRVMVILVVLGSILGAVGVYEPFSKWAGAGAGVPLTGYGNMLYKGVKEAVDKEGFIGIFKGGFTSSAVGVSAALIFSYIASWFFNSKMKS